MNTPEYSPSEMVRIELLRYQTPEGVHTIERAWRDLSRKLLAHTEELQNKLAALKPKIRYDDELEKWTPTVFPKPFEPANK